MPTIIIIPKTTRSPYQLYLVSLVILGGIGQVSGISANMVTRAMGHTLVVIWGCFLIVGGILILIGIFWPKEKFTALLIERSGLVALGGACLVWSILVVWRTHTVGLFGAILTFGLFLASLAQWRWVNSDVNSVIKAIDEHR